VNPRVAIASFESQLASASPVGPSVFSSGWVCKVGWHKACCLSILRSDGTTPTSWPVAGLNRTRR
jgi:hypothetical protein